MGLIGFECVLCVLVYGHFDGVLLFLHFSCWFSLCCVPIWLSVSVAGKTCLQVTSNMLTGLLNLTYSLHFLCVVIMLVVLLNCMLCVLLSTL